MATYKKREMNRLKAPVPSTPSSAPALEDSLSETRVMSPLASEQDSDLDQFDPFPVHVRDLQRAIRTIVEVEVIFQNYFFWGQDHLWVFLG